MASGDKWTCSFQGRSSRRTESPSATRNLGLREGSGKLKGIKGKGTYKGTPTADGTMTYTIEGEYSLP